jgi:hypothetical protein
VCVQSLQCVRATDAVVVAEPGGESYLITLTPATTGCNALPLKVARSRHETIFTMKFTGDNATVLRTILATAPPTERVYLQRQFTVVLKGVPWPRAYHARL